jgi:hypothetical protein
MSIRDVVVQGAEPRRPIKQQIRFPHSSVKVLETSEELHTALAQAIEFERDIAARNSALLLQYQELDGLGRVFSLRQDETTAGRVTETRTEAV